MHRCFISLVQCRHCCLAFSALYSKMNASSDPLDEDLASVSSSSLQSVLDAIQNCSGGKMLNLPLQQWPAVLPPALQHAEQVIHGKMQEQVIQGKMQERDSRENARA